jgi:hypothetical protein
LSWFEHGIAVLAPADDAVNPDNAGNAPILLVSSSTPLA